MSAIEDQLAADRAARDSARASLNDRVAQLRGALDKRSVKGRLIDEAVARAQAGADEALAVANDSRWVLVATVFALGAWFARQPLGRACQRIGERLAPEPSRGWRRWLDRVIRKARS